MRRKSARDAARRAVAADSPFAAVIGAGRRAARRRVLLRRAIAALAILAAAVVVLNRPGGSEAPTPAGASAAPGGGGLPAIGDLPESDASPPIARPAAVLPGAAMVPAGRVGVVLPIGDVVAARLRIGDAVDVYAVGSSKRVARDAHVVDVTRRTTPAADDLSAGDESGGAAGASSVFLAVRPSDVARIPAGQGSASGPDAVFLALSPRPAPAAEP